MRSTCGFIEWFNMSCQRNVSRICLICLCVRCVMWFFAYRDEALRNWLHSATQSLYRVMCQTWRRVTTRPVTRAAGRSETSGVSTCATHVLLAMMTQWPWPVQKKFPWIPRVAPVPAKAVHTVPLPGSLCYQSTTPPPGLPRLWVGLAPLHQRIYSMIFRKRDNCHLTSRVVFTQYTSILVLLLLFPPALPEELHPAGLT